MPFVKDEPGEVRIPSVQPEPTRTSALALGLATSDVKLERGVSRRLVMDYIEVPSLALLEMKRKREQLEEVDVKGLVKVSHCFLQSLPLWLTRPHAQSEKLKIKKLKTLPNIDLATISRRLDILGPPSERNLDIKLPNQAECLAAPRAFFSDTWGGSPVATHPSIGKEKRKEHPFRNFLCPNIEYNPVSSEMIMY